MDAGRREWIRRWANGWKETLAERDADLFYADLPLSVACDMIFELLGVPERARDAGGPVLAGGEIRDGAERSKPELPGHPTGSSAASGLSQSHAEVIARLVMLFRNRADDLDLALMKVIAEGGSPAEWIAGMLVASLPAEPAEPSPRPRFLGEG